MQNLEEQLSANEINTVLWDAHIKKAHTASTMKNFDEAVSLCELAMEKCMPLGMEDWRVLVTQRMLARFLVHAKQYDKAECLLSNAIEVIRTRLGAASPELLEFEQILAGVLEHRMYYHKAVKLMHHVVENHPQRGTSDLDFLAAKRKYENLRSKARQQDTWSAFAS
jgi:hypothetical protein